MKVKSVFTYISFALLFVISLNNLSASPLPTFFLGSKDAPVTIYEFSSLSCPHCKNSFNTLIPDDGTENPISNLIKNGKVKLVFMDQTIHGKKDVVAHSILYFSKNSTQFFSLIKMFMNNQENWFLSDNYKDVITNYARLSGMSNETIKAYLVNKTIPATIVKNSEYYMKTYHIEGTPTTIVEKSGMPITKNSIMITGEFDINELQKDIITLLK